MTQSKTNTFDVRLSRREILRREEQRNRKAAERLSMTARHFHVRLGWAK